MRTLMIATLLMLAPPAVAAPADLGADAPPMARDRYEIARRLYLAGRFADAAAEFETALRLYPGSGRLTFNLARSLERAGNLRRAVQHYEGYLALAPAAPDRPDVEALIGALRERLAQQLPELGLTSVPSGAHVWLDAAKAPAGKTPLQVRVEPGRHTVRVELDGYTPVLRTVAVQAGGNEVLGVTLAAIAPAPVAVTAEAPPPERPTWPWIVAGGGLAAAGVGLTLLSLAEDAEADRDAALGG